jgi:hypothetical protein
MDKILIGLLFLWVLTIAADIGLTQHLEKKCKDAGGVYATPSVCINPSAIIEVK